MIKQVKKIVFDKNQIRKSNGKEIRVGYEVILDNDMQIIALGGIFTFGNVNDPIIKSTVYKWYIVQNKYLPIDLKKAILKYVSDPLTQLNWLKWKEKGIKISTVELND